MHARGFERNRSLFKPFRQKSVISCQRFDGLLVDEIGSAVTHVSYYEEIMTIPEGSYKRGSHILAIRIVLGSGQDRMMCPKNSSAQKVHGICPVLKPLPYDFR